MKRISARAAPVVALLSVVFLAGCASLPPPVAKPVQHAFASPQTTWWGRQVAAAAPASAVSGFRLLQAGEDAFAALKVLIDRAHQTLDLQYYLIRDDVFGVCLRCRNFNALARRT